MAGYPITWDDFSPDGRTLSTRCPFSIEEMQTYLSWCHHNFSLAVPPMTFSIPKLVSERKSIARTLWFWELKDELERDWWIIVGTGTSLFYGAVGKLTWRWMCAQTKISSETDDDLATRLDLELHQH